MTEIQRIRKAINWLLYKGVAENDRELSEIMGYTKSSFSQIVNGRVPLSDKFAKKLCRLDENINEVWIMTGEGDMFKREPENNLNSEIDELMSLLKEQIAENKKAVARQEDNAASAAAV